MKSQKKLQIFIVDDHELVRKGLRLLIDGEDDMQVCCEASCIREAIDLKHKYHPDIAILDISLPDGSGLDLIKNLHQWRPETRILVLSMYKDEIFAERALKSGALGYINKQDSADKLLEGIRRVAKQKIFISPQMTESLLRRFSNHNDQIELTPLSVLSDRELQVFESIGQGQKTSQIAENLNLSIKTIETYRSNVKQKLKLKSGTELTRSAIMWSLENG